MILQQTINNNKVKSKEVKLFNQEFLKNLFITRREKDDIVRENTNTPVVLGLFNTTDFRRYLEVNKELLNQSKNIYFVISPTEKQEKIFKTDFSNLTYTSCLNSYKEYQLGEI